MAAQHDIVINQGSSFRMTLEYRNPDGTGIDLTGYTYLFQVRDKPGGTVLANLSTYVTKDASVLGRINVNVPHTITSAFNFDQGVYDVLVTGGTPSARTRLVKGRAFLDRAISA